MVANPQNRFSHFKDPISVNSEIFARVLFSLMISIEKIKSSLNDAITLSFVDIAKSRPRIFNKANMSFKAIRENKILSKIFKFTLSF